MARTPLLRSFQRLYADYRAARAHSLPLEGLRERRAEEHERLARGGAGPSRRQFLGAAAVAGVGLVPRPARAQGGGPKVAIVGGGIAGLTCALKLADRGIASTVYEASGRVGGRMFSNRDYFAGGQVTEWGGELIDSGHQTVQRLAKRFALPLDDMHAAQPAGSADLYHFFGSYYPKAQADLDFAPIFEAVAADEAAAPFPTLYDAFTPAGLELDQLSVYDWIESRVPGGHDAPLGALLDAAYAIEYAADTRHQAALNLIYLLAFQPVAGELGVFGESDEKFRIRGGNQRLPERIADELGDRVVSGHRLARLARTAALEVVAKAVVPRMASATEPPEKKVKMPRAPGWARVDSHVLW
jgi:monoamine oxidase